MERPPAYQPVSRDEEEHHLDGEIGEKDGIAWDSNNTDIIPTNTRAFVIYLILLLISLAANVLLVMDNAKLRIIRDRQISPYGMPLQMGAILLTRHLTLSQRASNSICLLCIIP